VKCVSPKPDNNESVDSQNTMTYKKKLIEVALPLEAINIASAREKSIRHGHPSTLHLWWARRPLAAARAVIFAQMVDDPSAHPDIFKTEKAQEKERQRLFRIIEQLVKWENTTNETVLQQARDEIWQSWRYTCAENADHPRAEELFDRHKLPAFHDPFAGGGALPLEAQRLGLESYASDLNPVAVLINKAMIEIPPKFAGRPPVNPEAQEQMAQMDKSWRCAQGLAEDVRYYGQWMRDEAERRIGHLYPKVKITGDMARERPDLANYVGTELTVVTWLWARTVRSPNPAFASVNVPLVSSFVLSPMAGKGAYVEPIVDKGGYRFVIRVGDPRNEQVKNGTKLSRGANFQCLVSGEPISGDYIKAEGQAGRMGVRLLAVVAEGDRERVYLSPTPSQEEVVEEARPEWTPEVAISGSTQYLGVKPYGIDRFDQLFTTRQLVALTTFTKLVEEARELVLSHARRAGLQSGGNSLEQGGNGALAYADAVAVYLAALVSKLADKGSSLCTWDAGPASNRTSSGRSARVATVRVTFGRQALAMAWDFAEVNFFSDSVGSVETVLKTLCAPLLYLPLAKIAGSARHSSAQTQSLSTNAVVSTDPPYYDNVPYADLSDFFYVWLRRSLKSVLPDLFSTVAVPKSEELVAFAYRHAAGKAGAEEFFLSGMTQAMNRIAEQAHPAFPVTIYYAFKQAESDGAEGTTNTGWETFLDAVIRAGFTTTGTWPMRTELGNRMRGVDSNALASSIVLVCRRRDANAAIATRREFVTALKAELPQALAHLQAGNIAPVDLAQAAIGPGMAVYTRYAKVLDAEGKPIPVRAALALINQTLDEALAEQEGDFDADTRWALTWFEQSGFTAGEYGVAEQLSKSKNTSVAGLVQTGILASKAGKVRLLAPDELPDDWDPSTDTRLTVWEMVHQLIRALNEGGEPGAANLVAKLGSKAEVARELCYRLYTLCERKKRAAEAIAYNALVQSWPEITRLASDNSKSAPPQPAQAGLL
jgi:putative DNA methylase